MLPLVTTGLSTAANIWGQAQSAKAAKEAENYNTSRMNNLTGWFNKEYYGNYLDGGVAKAAMARYQANMKQQQDALKNSAVAGGSTAEAVIANQGEQNRNYNDAVNNLVGMGEQKKENVQTRYQGLMQPLENNQANILAGKVQNGQNVVNNVNNTAGNALLAWAYSSKKGTPKS